MATALRAQHCMQPQRGTPCTSHAPTPAVPRTPPRTDHAQPSAAAASALRTLVAAGACFLPPPPGLGLLLVVAAGWAGAWREEVIASSAAARAAVSARSRSPAMQGAATTHVAATTCGRAARAA